MISNLFNTKKLLFLGATQFQLPAIKTAQRLGVQVIVTDNVPSNIGHFVGDFSENISTTDLEGLVGVARKYNIDGVMTYGSDVSSPGVSFVAEKLNLPGNPYNSAKILQRKDEFRKFQKQAGLPHPCFVIIDEGFNADKINLHYPVLVKPSDSSGSKGLTIIESSTQVQAAIAKAREYSRCGTVVCEELLKSNILELDGDILMKNGKLSFGHYGHNYFLKESKLKVPIGEIMPGFFGKEVIDQLDEQLQKIIASFNLVTGCLNFDALLVDGKVVILDIGLRNGGNYVPDLIKMSTGVDLTEAAVYCALGVEYPIQELHVAKPKPVMTYILNAKEEGQYTGIRYADEIVNHIKKSINFVEFESEVQPFTRGDYALGVAFLEFDSQKEMLEKWQTVEDYINIDVVPKNDVGKATDKREEYKRYNERISPFLKKQINKARTENRQDILKVLTTQFVFNKNETAISENEVTKHYDAAADFIFEGTQLFGVERLYKRQIVVDITLKCVAHCRHCLRRNYDPFILTNDDLSRIARFIGQSEVVKDVREILITGGDPFLVPKKLSHFLNELDKNAPSLEIVRVASRVPIHQPDWINDNILSILKKKYSFRVEMATQINHSIELFPEVREAYMKIRNCVSAIYNQTVLLKKINDTANDLVHLYDDLRSLGIESHYLFHCVPIGGIDWLRTSLVETMELADGILNSGMISGRAKPRVTFMTDIGKIALNESAIIRRDNDKVLLRSSYSLENRLKWNPSWKIPTSAIVEKNGMLSVWYKIKNG
jgi:lysine 2,3-aminomutase